MADFTGAHIWKAARLAVLLDAQDRGLLKGRSLQQIATALGTGPHGEPVDRSTILRDLRQIPQVRALREVLASRLSALE